MIEVFTFILEVILGDSPLQMQTSKTKLVIEIIIGKV